MPRVTAAVPGTTAPTGAAGPYLGLGPAAHSYDGRTRRWNLAAWEAYRRALAEGRSPVESEETLTDEQRELERLYLGLRTADGIAFTPPPSSRLFGAARAGLDESRTAAACAARRRAGSGSMPSCVP